jgi:hypothetical protein
MGNHYHLLLRTPSGGLSEAMHYLGLVYVRRTNDRIGRDGPLFRARFRSIRVTTDAYLAYAARYIHRNPLDLPDVADVSSYRWSSYRVYLGHRRVAPFLNTEPVLGLFGHDVRALTRFTDGSDWLDGVGGRVGALDVLQLVQLGVAAGSLESDDDEKGPWIERSAAILIADVLSDQRLGGDLLDALDFASDSARRMAQKRARDRAAHPRVSHVVAFVLGTLHQVLRAA